jgi:hypothetical protein
LPIDDLIVHADDSELPPTVPLRADLVERSFAHAPDQEPSSRAGRADALPAVPR